MNNTSDHAVAEQVAQMIDLEDAAPAELFAQVVACLKIIGHDAVVDFDGGEAGFSSSARFNGAGEPVPVALDRAIQKLAPPLIRCEIAEWSPDRRTTGRLMVDRSGEVFLDAEDIEGDWDYQRGVDTDLLDDAEFEPAADENDPLPA